MKITPAIFEAFLKCPTKCWLRSRGEVGTGNEYATWFKSQNESYRLQAARQLTADIPPGECATTSPQPENLKSARWRFATDVAANTQNLESTLHVVERVPSEGRGKAATFIPIHFIFTNKLTRDDKLLVGFDAFVLSEVLGREVGLGKVVHGDNHATLRVKTSALADDVRKLTDKIATLLASSTAPDLILNRHCGECEFQNRCRQKAIEKDDLSLLSGMSEKERKKLHRKGIFTVTQLSYTFRPRRRPKRLRDKKEKYHHSLKALAIREKRIHVVGTPELKMEGIPVYLDVEGLPDRDFYYLIGMRIGSGETAVQHSFWAATVEEESKIWREFLAALETIEKPVLIHYGSYETTWLEAMSKRYGAPESTAAGASFGSSINLLSIIFGQIYFPTYSNGLKETGCWLGFVWREDSLVGPHSVHSRHEWEQTREAAIKERLISYNADDCEALAVLAKAIFKLRREASSDDADAELMREVHVESLKHPARKIGPFKSPVKAFEELALSAWWDYQRDRIYIKRTKPVWKNPKCPKRERIGSRNLHRFNKSIFCSESAFCPFCGAQSSARSRCTRTVYDLRFGRFSIRRWIARYYFRRYWCSQCQRGFGEPVEIWPQSHFGRNLVAYVLYETIDLFIPLVTVQENLSRFFGLDAPANTILSIKNSAGQHYAGVFEAILRHLVGGNLLHVDETQVSIRGSTAYVWVFTNLNEVAYLYTPSREGAFLHEILKDFTGVLVSDFYGAYDSLKCRQQKCLIHLMRDLNDDILAHPYDEELKAIINDFAALLSAIVETIHHRGLKRRFLGKHLKSVNQFYRKHMAVSYQSEEAIRCKERFKKNRDKLFTFLRVDGIPWNNNNAEHAVKAFAKLRDIVRGSFTEPSLRNYLVLLTISQTCKYSGVDFLDFLRTGEKDIYAFTESKGRRKRSTLL